MQPKILHAHFLKAAEALKKLGLCKAVFGILWVIHDVVANGEIATRVKPAADGFGKGREQRGNGIDIRIVIQVERGPQLMSV